MQDLIGWLVLGAIVGFVYGWRRTKASYDRARAEIESVRGDGTHKRQTIGRIQGLRLSTSTIFLLIGALGGGLIWSAASLVLLLLE